MLRSTFLIYTLWFVIGPGMPSTAAGDDFSYRYGATRVSLAIEPELVIEVEGVSTETEAGVVLGDLLDDPGVRGFARNENRIALSLDPELESEAIIALARAASANPAVTACSPVFTYGSTEVLVQTELLVVHDAEASIDWREHGFELHGLELHGLELLRVYPGSTPIAHVAFVGCAVDVFAECARLESLPFVRSASPNFIERRLIADRPDDPFFPDQWAHENSGQGPGTPGADVRSLYAFNMEIDASGVVIAVLDEGVDLDHPDLEANILPGYDATDQPPPGGLPGNASSNDPHGTLCAGVAAAIGNNGLGVAGMAWSAKILPVRVGYGSYWTETAWTIDAITWAADNGADVISCSWGGAPPSVAQESAIDYARDTGRAGLGCAVIFATQNGDDDIVYPAAYPNTIAVGATSPCDERKSPFSCDGEFWWGSNYGPELTLVAPGVDLPTTDIVGVDGFTSTDYLPQWGGTSAATPLVAGAVALLLALDPDLTASEVEGRLSLTAADQVGPDFEDTPGHDEFMGWGRLDVGALLGTVWPDTRLVGSDIVTTAGSTVSYNVHATSQEALEAITLGARYPQPLLELIEVTAGPDLDAAEFFAIVIESAEPTWTLLAQYPIGAALPASSEAWLATATFAVSPTAPPNSSPFDFPPISGVAETPTLFFSSPTSGRTPNLEPGTISIAPFIETFLRGDANADSSTDLADVLVILVYLFQGGALACADGADLGDDGVVGLDDVFSLLAFLFQSGPAPADPYPLPGGDPTVDGLGCP